MSTPSLPAPTPNQAYVTISPLAAGHITLPNHLFTAPEPNKTTTRTVPSLAFLITHPSPTPSNPSTPTRLMFDLGLRPTLSTYPAPTRHHLSTRAPYTLAPGAAAQLAAADVPPESIDLVLLSHVHYDHHGAPADFPRARFLVGHGALGVLANGLGDGHGHQHFDAELFAGMEGRCAELPAPGPQRVDGEGVGATTGEGWDEWRPLGPFPHALDLFRDGSVFVLDAPGHLPGHLNLLCRTRERWVCLAGDAFHDRRLLTGEREIGTWEGEGGRVMCIHADRKGAEESLARLRRLGEVEVEGGVEIVAAHEEGWWEECRRGGRAFPGIL